MRLYVILYVFETLNKSACLGSSHSNLGYFYQHSARALRCGSCVGLFAALWTLASRLLCSWCSPGKILEWVVPGDLPDLGSNTHLSPSPALQVDSLPLSHLRSPYQDKRT